ncbi:hypothetical protein D3C86_1771750 [compost metagenome]
MPGCGNEYTVQIIAFDEVQKIFLAFGIHCWRFAARFFDLVKRDVDGVGVDIANCIDLDIRAEKCLLHMVAASEPDPNKS